MATRTISAMFKNGSSVYDYLVPEGDEPNVGDIIVTSSDMNLLKAASRTPPILDETSVEEVVNLCAGRTVRAHIAEGYVQDTKTAVIVEVHDVPSEKATRFYLGRVGAQQALNNYAETERQAERIKKRKAALVRLEKMAKEIDRLAVYRQLAATNPEAAELLKIIEE